MMLSPPDPELVRFRQNLHRHPDLSDHEGATAALIREQLESLHPDHLLPGLGGEGLAATWEGSEPGPWVLFRSDLDALPIQDTGATDHRSEREGVGHLCGHDGHMTMMLGLAQRIAAEPPKRGRATVLFQPAEETGEGAARVIEDPKFGELKPDYVYALHNVPGFAKGRILLRSGPFAMASKGMIVRLHGKTSHAAHPEKGRSPALAMAEIVQTLTNLAPATRHLEDFALATVIHAVLGEVAFGTTPGEAVVMATLRSALDADMERLVREAEDRIDAIVERHGLTHEVEWTEVFPATVNDEGAVDVLRKAVKEAGLDVQELPEPFRWSEDVGHFGKVGKLVLFGLGSGENQPALHNPDYDFPDEILPYGIVAFTAVLRALTSGA